MTEWVPLDEFPNYSVNHTGQIRNEDTGRLMVLTANQQGVVQVGLTKHKHQYKRGVALLVARAFLPPPTPSTFNTPIQLDGDRYNCHAENLMWRPRWFAIKYHQQFHNDIRGFPDPIIEVKTKERFKNSWEAAIKYGLLDRDILIATLNRTYVWPTYQVFKVIE